MSDYLLVSDEVPRLVDSDRANAAWGLARGLLARQHRVTILTCAGAEAAAHIPGLARRLRKITGTVAGQIREMALFEGRFAAADPQLLVVDADAGSPEQRALWLGAAATGLSNDGLIKADVLIGWGESSAIALARVPAVAKFFVLPDGSVQEMSSGGLPAEIAATVGLGDGVAGEPASLAAIGAIAAQAVVVPSPAAARALQEHPALAIRASDEPIFPVRFGCDEPPFDPNADMELPATFSAAAPDGKRECRKALARQCALAVGPHTLLLAVTPIRQHLGGAAVVDAIAAVMDRDVCVVASGLGDRILVERLRILAIENPTKVVVLDAGARPSAGAAALEPRRGGHPRDERRILAAADAVLIADANDLTGRLAGRALRYGAVPIAPLASAVGDQLVDIDVPSVTGFAVLFPGDDAAAIESALIRTVALRQASASWDAIVPAAMLAAPSWNRAAEVLDLLAAGALAAGALAAGALAAGALAASASPAGTVPPQPGAS